MNLIYKFKLKKDKNLLSLMEISKNLYNQCNYLIREEFIKNNNYIGYDIEKIIKNTQNLEGNYNYKLLPAQTSQQIIRLLQNNWLSFFRSIKSWSKNKNRGKPNVPTYIKNKHNILIFTNQNLRLKNNRFKIKKFGINIHIPRKNIIEKFQQVRIIRKNNETWCEVIYNKEIENHNLDNKKYLSIDLGVNNLITSISNDKNLNPLIINGRELKAINQLYQKKIGKLKRIRTNGKNIKSNKDKKYFKNTKRMYGLLNDRNYKFNDIFHKISTDIIRYSIENGIGNICVGELRGLKANSKLNKRQNQQIQSIPFNNLKQKIKYKCELHGIKYLEVNEAYTSKCDALSLESIEKHDVYLGSRIKRGLFRSKLGLINADVNGALNILRKVIGDSFIKSLINSGIVFCPIKIRSILTNSYKMILFKNLNKI